MARTGRRAHRGHYVFIFCLGALAIGLGSPWAFSAQTKTPQDAILSHLNEAISWYRRLASLDITAGQPSDALYLESARSSAAEALQLAFQASQAQALLIQSKNNAGGGGNEPPASDQQTNIARAITNTNARISQTQAQLDDLNKQLGSARGKKRQELLSQREALQGNLDLEKTILDAVQKIASVTTSNNDGAKSGLGGQINQLKQSVPEVFATAKKETTSIAPQSSKSNRAQNSGLFGQTSILFGQMRDMHDIDQLISETERLRNNVDKIDAPLRDLLKSLVQQGRELVNQPPSPDPAQVAATRQKFDTLTAQFKQISAAAVPMRQEMILLDQCRGDLQEWRRSIGVEYGRVLRSLLMRVAGILIALGFVFLLSEVWRRTTYKYVREARRRRQVMLIRRFVTGFLVVVVIALGFVSEFSSLATFAGFITAGIAVALQTVILSIAAYFFLIGRYGVRVGDRLTVSGVTGDVIEVGLVRLYLMELSGTGIDLYPTGRVVVFSNSVMFQAAPFFKQLPGTAYAWHEVAVYVAAEANLSAVEKKLLDTVSSIYARYQHNIDRQHALVERIVDTPIAAPEPNARVYFADSGLELVVRYPVEIQSAAEIDDEVTRKLMETIGRDAELKAAVTGSPKLRAAIRA